MKPELSIIMPCYNCERTIEEAVDSCYDQGLRSFEIVMVDDGSTDRTREIMKKLSQKYKEVRLFFHENNKGGGAARNTAVKNSRANIIFCLDSDDILPPAMLPKMLDMLKNKRCDGVIFQETRFFESSENRTDVLANKVASGQHVVFSDLFKKKGFLTQVNFMYTKEAYAKSGGYPESHGFDTQAFGYRFLAKGHKVLVCPDTYYLHRRHQKHKSYFERIHEDGQISVNMYFIYEDVIELLPDPAVRIIMAFDIFRRNKLGKDNLQAEIEPSLADGVMLNSGQGRDGAGPIKDFRSAIRSYKDKDYPRALDAYEKILAAGFVSPLIFFNIIRCSLAIAGIPEEKIGGKVSEIVRSLTAEKRERPSLLRRLYGKARASVSKLSSNNQ